MLIHFVQNQVKQTGNVHFILKISELQKQLEKNPTSYDLLIILKGISTYLNIFVQQ